MEQVPSEQIFMDGLTSAEMETKKLVFPQLKEIATLFAPFKENLVKRENNAQVVFNTLFVPPIKLKVRTPRTANY